MNLSKNGYFLATGGTIQYLLQFTLKENHDISSFAFKLNPMVFLLLDIRNYLCFAPNQLDLSHFN
jgi:hypothetical protein